jgi:hypothetical protein
LLKEVAEFAQRFKLGGEDKIRVVGGVCEGVSLVSCSLSGLQVSWMASAGRHVLVKLRLADQQLPPARTRPGSVYRPYRRVSQVISHQTHLLSLLSHSSLLQPRSAPLAEGSSYLPPTLPGKRTRARAGAEIGGGAGGNSGVNGGNGGGGGGAGGAPTPVKKRKVGLAGRGATSAVDDDDGGRYAGTSGRAGLEGGRSPKLPTAVPKKSAAAKKKATCVASPSSILFGRISRS